MWAKYGHDCIHFYLLIRSGFSSHHAYTEYLVFYCVITILTQGLERHGEHDVDIFKCIFLNKESY